MNTVDLYVSDAVEAKLASKHDVEVDEVIEVLMSAGRRIFRAREGSYLALGRTDAGRFLTVFFFTQPTPGGVLARIATARDMDAAERQRFLRK